MYVLGFGEVIEILTVTVQYAHSFGKRNALTKYLLGERLTDTLFSIFLIIAFVSELVDDHEIKETSPTLPDFMLAVAVILLNVRMLTLFSTNSQLGPLLLMVKKCFVDIAKFSYLLFSCGLCFVVAYTFILRRVEIPGLRDDGTYALVNFGARIWTMIWMIIGEEMQIMPHLPGAEFMRAVGFVYAFYVIVILMNLLIAMMGDTYGAVKESSEAEWRLSRAKKLVNASHADMLPPPFDSVLNLLRLFRWMFCSCKIDETTKDKESASTKHTARAQRYAAIVQRSCISYFKNTEGEQGEGIEIKIDSMMQEIEAMKRFLLK
jgi:hypothetical protein